MRTVERQVDEDATHTDDGMTDEREWLVTDGLGGFASGTAEAIRRRREQGVLVAADPRSARHWLLVAAVETWLELEDERIALSSHRYAPDVVHPDGSTRIASFNAEPWPTWRYR